MGTNYYLLETPPCPTCGHYPENDLRHIGKSSYGWAFALRVYPRNGINTLDDWRPLFQKFTIVDEYGKTHTPEQMLECITTRGPGRWSPDGHELHRHDWRARPGPGTYDYCDYEFT